MGLLETRNVYKPFEYPWAYDFYKKQSKAHWMPEESPLDSDIQINHHSSNEING